MYLLLAKRYLSKKKDPPLCLKMIDLSRAGEAYDDGHFLHINTQELAISQ